MMERSYHFFFKRNYLNYNNYSMESFLNEYQL